MKSAYPLLLTFGLSLALPPYASAAVITVNSPVLNSLIPDGGASVLNAPLSIDAPSQIIESVRVSFVIEGVGAGGAWNGDFYVGLIHEDVRAQLLNRPGVTASNPIGYPDNGFNVTFDDDAPSDIHNYREFSVPALSQPLTGVWQPDARADSPTVVTDASPRTQFLSQFVGLPAHGNWILSLADLEFGSTGRLVQWGLEITTVPEPKLALATAGLALLGFAWVRGSRARKSHS